VFEAPGALEKGSIFEAAASRMSTVWSGRSGRGGFALESSVWCGILKTLLTAG
jgi:hypothetical protein